MGQFRFLAAIILVVAIGLSPQGAYGADCFGNVEFKDTEYGFNYDKWWSIWRKPVTTARAESIAEASVAYLKVPEAMQEADSGYRTLGGPMRRAKSKHPDVKLYTNDESKFEHVIVLVISPVGVTLPGLVQHEKVRLMTEPLIPKKRKHASVFGWDVYLVITKGTALAGKNPHFPHWPNYREGWRVALCKAAS